MMLKIKRDINIISDKLEQHKNKWFNSYRKVNCKKELLQLKKHSRILNERLELFFKAFNLTIS